MNRLVLAGVLAATALTPVLASAQSRSMIPPETLETMQRRQDTMFDRMDANRDGAITAAEVEAAAATMRARRADRAGGPPAGAAAAAPPQGGPGQGGMMGRMIEEADADGDGQVSREEMRAATAKRFASMDKNSDGVISTDERPQGFGMRGGRQGGGEGGGASVQIPMGDEGD